MHISLHFSPQSRGPHEDLALLEQVVAHAELADRAGIAGICLTEHHGGGFNTYADPFLLAAHLAGRLENAHLAITVVQMALRHPMSVAEHCNIVDLMMRGRALFALAPGSAAEVELGIFGAEDFDRRRVTEERIAATLRAWDREGDDEPTDISTVVDRGTLRTRVSPASFRRPHPLVARATATLTTIERVAQDGWPVILGTWLTGSGGDNTEQLTCYRKALDAAQHPPAIERECLSWLGFITPVVIGATQGEADRRFDAFLERGGSGPVPGRLGSPQTWAAEWSKRELARATGSIVGTPERVAEHFVKMHEAGAPHPRAVLVGAAGDASEQDDALQLFLEEVLPQLDPEPLPAPANAGVPAPTAGESG